MRFHNLVQCRLGGSKRLALLVAGFALFSAGNAFATTVGFDVTPLEGSVFRYEFFPADLALQANQEIEIEFDPASFGGLLNGVAGADFRLTLLQPDNPPGAPGIYSALALVDDPSLSGRFQLDAVWTGRGSPGPLSFSINQFDAAGQLIIRTLETGALGAPEPSASLLCLAGLGMMVATLSRRSQK